MVNNYHFRFEDLEIWRQSINLAKDCIKISGELERKRYYRFADQLRAAALSISNNIAEGAGSKNTNEFKRYLGYARASTFECANIMFVLLEMEFDNPKLIRKILFDLDHISRRISSFSKYLNS